MSTERQDPRLIEAFHHARRLQVRLLLEKAKQDAQKVGDYLENENYHAYLTLAKSDPAALGKFEKENPQRFQELKEKAGHALKNLATRVYVPAVLLGLLEEVDMELDHTHELICDAALYGTRALRITDSTQIVSQVIDQAHEAGVQQLLDVLRGENSIYRMSRSFAGKNKLPLVTNNDGSEDYRVDSIVPNVEIALRFFPGKDMPIVLLRINPPTLAS